MRSSAFFSLPHTYWSIVTASFAGSGAVPFRTTVPLMVTPDAAREVARPVTSITTPAPSKPARKNVIGADLTRRHRSTQAEKNFTSRLDTETMARCDVGAWLGERFRNLRARSNHSAVTNRPARSIPSREANDRRAGRFVTAGGVDRKRTRLNSRHQLFSYAVFCF